MNSERGGGRGSFATAAASDSSTKEKTTIHQHGHSSGGFGSGNNHPEIDQLNCDSAQGGEWEVRRKKSRSRRGNGAPKLRGDWTAFSKARSHQEMPKKPCVPGYVGTGNTSGGRGNVKPQPSNRDWEATYMAPLPPIPLPFPCGWQWSARAGSLSPSQSKTSEDEHTKNGVIPKPLNEGIPTGEYTDHDSDDNELISDSDEDLLSDDYDSDMNRKSRDIRKNKWINKFFVAMEHLTIDQINEPSRQWHCPACHGGPGAIDWYRGLQALMRHAKMKESKRVLFHREFADLLEEKLQGRGALVIPRGKSFGRWKGLSEMTAGHEIVWPPMVVVMNTLLEKDENEKWIGGIGDQELLDYFSSYDAVKAQHSYDPQGHRGMSVLIFEGSAVGYLEAERLHKHFSDKGTDRDAWEHRRVLFIPGGRRQLYGYIACKKDMNSFNQYSQGKSKLKFEMRSYQEMVVGPMKQMSEENQLLIWYKNKAAIDQQHEKDLEQTLELMSKQLRITNEENRIVKQKATIQHEENKEQMNNMEHFFKKQVAAIQDTIEAKVRAFEKLLQEEREKRANNTSSGSKVDCKLRFIDSQMKGIEGFEAEIEKLVKAHEDKKIDLKRKYLAYEVEMEKEFDDSMTKLMEKYTPHQSESSASS
ncbi:hypothetical protein AAC387_Pa07g1335 [Persea americana]